jgi:CheY-like chemotaxis protein
MCPSAQLSSCCPMSSAPAADKHEGWQTMEQKYTLPALRRHERKAMTPAILLVGDDPILLETRTDSLKAWQVSTTNSQHAVEELRSKFYDLIIFCQTIPDETSRALIDQAHKLDPTVKTLEMRVSGPANDVGTERCGALLEPPHRLRTLVAFLLEINLPYRQWMRPQ